MRLGIFSDVHSNLPALTAVVRAYDREKIDRFVCLGDVVGYGARPQECAERVRDMASVTVLGNHDAAVAGRMDYSYYYEAARAALDLHRRWVSEENIRWLRSLSYEHREQGVAYCHGSPNNYREFDYVFSVDQARGLLFMYDELATVTFIGHSHLCRAYALTADEVHEVVATKFTIRENYKYVVSVGSVGQPRDCDSRAAYTIYDTDARTFELKRVEYDIEKAANAIFETDLEPNFGNRLFLGV